LLIKSLTQYLFLYKLKSIFFLFERSSGKIKFLVIAKNDEVCHWWRESLKRLSIQSHVRPWSVDNGRGWTRHEDVRRYTKHNALRIHKSCVGKLNHLEESASSYKQLVDRRDSYQIVINSCNQFGSKNSAILSPSALIAKEELLQKGFKFFFTFEPQKIKLFVD